MACLVEARDERILEMSRQELERDLAAARYAVQTERYNQAAAVYTRILEKFVMPTRAISRIEHDRAYAYLNAGDLEKAEADLRNALRKDYHFASAHALMAELAFQRKEYERAQRHMDFALKLEQHPSPEWMLRRIKILVEQGDRSTVNRLMKQHKQDFEGQPDYHFLEGTLALERNDLRAALAQFRETVRLSPNTLPAKIAVAETLRRSGEVESAMVAVDQILSSHPDNPKAVHLKALILLHQGRHVEAIEAFTRLMALDPERVDYRLDRALAFARLNNLDAALKDVNAGLRIEKSNAHARYRKAMILQRKGLYGPALASFNAAIDLAPGRFEYLLARGFLFESEGKLIPALKDYDRYIENAKIENPVALAMRARVYLRLNRLADAKMDVDRALEMSPNSSLVYFVRGMWLQATGQNEEAVEQYNLALEQNTSTAGLIRRGQVLEAMGSADAAIKDYQMSLDLYEDSLTPRKQLAGLFFEQERFTESLEQLDVIEQRHAMDPETLWLKFQICSRQRNWDEALAIGQELAHTEYKQSDEFHALRGQIYRMTGDTKSATSAYTLSLNLFPGSPSTWLGLAEVYLKAGKYAEAFQSFSQAKRLNPEDTRGAEGEIRALLAAGLDPEEGEELKDWRDNLPDVPGLLSLDSDQP